MKQVFLTFLLGLLLIVTGCGGPMSNKLNAEDFVLVKDEINADGDYSPMKKKYLIERLDAIVKMSAIFQGNEEAAKNMPTFKSQIDELSADFDSIREVKLAAVEQNKVLDNFMVLKSAGCIPHDEYKGYLSMDLGFNNTFDKKVLYTVMEYYYEGTNNTRYFTERSKLTDEVAKGFKEDVSVTTTEQYNDAAKFMYEHVPYSAPQELIDKMGETKAIQKTMSDKIMEGLKVKTLLVVFEDKTELQYEDTNWEYMD